MNEKHALKIKKYAKQSFHFLCICCMKRTMYLENIV